MDDELAAWSDTVAEQNRRGCEAARTFYRGTSIKEAPDVASRKGSISKDGRFDFTSLSTLLGAALKFGQYNPIRVVLEYDGDSIRTGEAAPVEYSHKHSSLDQARGRGMPLMDCLEPETRIPEKTKGPILKRVLLSADNVRQGSAENDKKTGGCREMCQPFLADSLARLSFLSLILFSKSVSMDPPEAITDSMASFRLMLKRIRPLTAARPSPP